MNPLTRQMVCDSISNLQNQASKVKKNTIHLNASPNGSYSLFLKVSSSMIAELFRALIDLGSSHCYCQVWARGLLNERNEAEGKRKCGCGEWVGSNVRKASQPVIR
jgi:hypothetical protein